MDDITSSKSQALVVESSKGKKQTKDQAKRSKSDTLWNLSPSSKGKISKDKPKCTYCKGLGHEEHQCYKNEIDDLMSLLQQTQIEFPKTCGSSLFASTSSTFSAKDKNKAIPLISSTNNTPHKWLLNFGASHHMDASRELFSTFYPCSFPPILIANNTYMSTLRKGSIKIGEGKFNDVLYEPSLSNNPLSIYQITHSGTRKIVVFTQHYVIIRYL